MSQPLISNTQARRAEPRIKRFVQPLRRWAHVWFGLRLLLSFWVAIWSMMLPLLPQERAVHGWPPSLPIGAWLERVFLLPWLRWDVSYYLNIATRGYRLDDGTAQFHPLYPWLGQAAGLLLGGNMLLGLLVVSSGCTLACYVWFERLALLDLPPSIARRATLYFALAPISFILFAPYTESLFLLCSILALFHARQRHWWLAGAAGGFAALTRQQGIFLLVPLAWEVWEASERQWSGLRRSWRAVLALMLVPFGLLLWLIYRGFVLGDVAFDPAKPQTLIYSLLISRSSAQVVPLQAFVPPWTALRAAFNSLSMPGSYTTLIELVLGGLFALVFALGWRWLWRLRPSYLLYSFVMLLVSFSYYTGPFFPYMGLQRHCLLAFPIFLPLAVWGRRIPIHWLVVIVGLLGMLFLSMLYSIEAWVP